MRITDIMNTEVDYVSTKTSVVEVARLIFGHGINGVPVCDNKKVIGFITERDILSRFYPTIQDYIEDPVHAGDFEAMEGNITEILNLTAEDIMSKHPITVFADTPVLHAQSLMFVHKVGRLPVVNRQGILVGLVSKGDIFRAVVGKKVPFGEEEEFYDWLARYYDHLFDWKKRLAAEIPSLVKLFEKNKVASVLDVASSNGEHVVALAEEGFSVTGIEASALMHYNATVKQARGNKKVKDATVFLQGSYKQLLEKLNKKFDAALFMGNALSHVHNTDKDILEDVMNVLSKNGVMVLQIVNYDKVLEADNGLREFTLPEIGEDEKYALIGFYTKPSGQELTFTRAAFQWRDGGWVFRGVKTIPVWYINEQQIVKELRKLGFSTIDTYGSTYNMPLFAEKFDKNTHDLLTVVAKR